MAIVPQGDDMKFFNRSKNNCKDVCHLYKAPKTITSEGVVNQFKCTTCKQYIFPNGIERKHGEKLCRCCGHVVVYIKTIKDDPELKETKKSIPNSFTKETFGRKTFDQFLEFLENDIQLQANYQLVVLKFLIGSKMAEKIEIAEELAYQNNKDFNDPNEVKKFLSVPVFDVLENRGFIKKITHDDEEQYMLNIEITDLEATRSFEIIDKQLTKYNLEHDIPENQFDSISNNNSAKIINVDTENDSSEKSEELQRTKNYWIWSTTSDNWGILKRECIWGSRVIPEKISSKVKDGDVVAFYVIGTNSFKGIFEFTGSWYDSPGKTWKDDVESDGKLRYASQIKIKPVSIGDVKLSELYEELELFKNKETHVRNLILQGSGGYPSNNSQPLFENDFEIILSKMKNKEFRSCTRCGELKVPRWDSRPLCRDCAENKTFSVSSTENSSEDKIDEKEHGGEKIVFLDNSSNGIHLKEYVETKSEEIVKGQVLSNDDLMNKFGVGNMGGIRHSKKNNILVLCSSLSNDYDDSLDPHSGLIIYSGEGRTGDQEISKGNAKILDSKNTMLFFKEKYQEPGARKRGALDNLYEFVGKVNCVKHYWKEEPDVEKNSRKVIKFVLEVES